MKVNYLITKHGCDLISRVTLNLIANWTLLLQASPRPTENSVLFQKCFSIQITIYFQLVHSFHAGLQTLTNQLYGQCHVASCRSGAPVT